VNKEAQVRMQERHNFQQEKLAQKIYEVRQTDANNEMAECTFSPRVVVSNAAKRYNEKLGNRTGKSFTRAQDQFLAKKEQWL
jgi:hypothetical protein